ncbi:MAG: sigma 54-dependent Fis family transcriptional regulator [Gammaproteobacteria bacterium]
MSSSDEAGGTEAIRVVTGQSRRIQLEAIELQVISGPDTGLKGSYSLPILRIGTAPDNDIVLTDRAVSRHHAEIRLSSEGMLLKDLGSTNGTFVGQLRVTEAYLAPDTECVLGYSHLRIRQHTEEHRFEVPSRQDHLGQLVGASKPMRELYGLLHTIAPTPTTVMIHGESGSGKELVARTLHELSGRKGPIVVFDASVADPEMVRNDLFGHVKGAYTGAAGSREGAFRRAHLGTLFIDEIGELPLDLQPRLLRALENREVTPMGSDQSVRVDVRVITATHRNLEAMVQEGTFRADLFYRLSVVPIKVPPLRDIAEDIPLLVQSFIERLGLRCRVSPAAMIAMQRYHWPGNVRELRNVLERAAVLCHGGEIQPADLRLPGVHYDVRSHPMVSSNAPVTPTPVSRPSFTSPETPNIGHLRDLERKMILDTLSRNGNNKTAAARELGIPLSTLKRRLKDYQIG